MRESIGGTWLLGFVVLFIVLFSGYLAVSINYTKAFKVKNKVLDIIEQNQGYTESSFDLGTATEEQLKESVEGKIYSYLKNVGYATTAVDSSRCPAGTYKQGGYCLEMRCSTTTSGCTYKVTTFIKIELPILWQSFTVPISGETVQIY